MSASEVQRSPSRTDVASTSARSFAPTRALRPKAKLLPEHARGHNRSLVLQTLYRSGPCSRADIARTTGLTRVTVSDLVAELIADGLLEELGQREESRPGKPATLLDLRRDAFVILGLDLSEHSGFSGAVLDLDGRLLAREEVALEGSTGDAAIERVLTLVARLVEHAGPTPILGLGVGSPGVVDLGGVVLSAPNLGWTGVPLQETLHDRFGVPVVVANDANAAILAEHGFGGASADAMLIKIGHGVGAGLLLDGRPMYGSRFAAGEIGHVVVGTDGGDVCACGKRGCLETWLSIPRLERALTGAPAEARDRILEQAGERLGIALAPVVGALDLGEVILAGPTGLLDGPLAAAALETIRSRTMSEFHGDLSLRMSTLGQDIVLRGAAVMVLSGQLGVS